MARRGYPPFEIDVLDEQFKTFVATKPGSVEEKGDQTICAGESLQDRRHFASG